jgi:hypothetical protein
VVRGEEELPDRPPRVRPRKLVEEVELGAACLAGRGDHTEFVATLGENATQPEDRRGLEVFDELLIQDTRF